MSRTALAPPAAGIDRWIDSYRSDGELLMPEWLHAQLHEERRRGRRKFMLALALPVLTFALVLGIVIAAAFFVTASFGFELALLSLVILPLLAIGIAYLLGRDGLRASRAARRDLRHGMVERFTMDPRIAEAIAAEVERGAIPLRPPEMLEVLPASSRLIARDGIPVSKRETVTIAHLAQASDDVSFEPIQVSPLLRAPARGAAGALLERIRSHAAAQRAMNAAERRELIRFRRRLFRSWLYVPIPAIFVSFGLMAAAAGTITLRQGIFLTFWAAMGAFAIFGIVRSQSLARRIGRDIASGCVYVVDSNGMLALAMEDDPDHEPRSTAELAEFLPGSGMPWSIDGVPAPWRVAVQAKKA